MTGSDFARLVVVLASFAGAPAADLLVVDARGSGDFTNVQSAVDAAADGDVIRIDIPSLHSEDVEIDGKSLTLFSEAPDLVLFGSFHVLGLAPAQTVTLIGLEIWGKTTLSETLEEKSALYVSGCQGAVIVVDCTLLGGYASNEEMQRGGPGATMLGADHVVFVRTSIRAGTSSSVYSCTWCCCCQVPGIEGGTGLFSQASNVALYDCEVSGPTAIEDCGHGGDGGHGAEVASGTLYAAGCLFEGGDGNEAVDWIEGFTPGNGGDAFRSLGNAHIRTLDTTFAPGLGGEAFFGAIGDPGLGLVVTSLLLEFDGSARQLEAPSLMHASEQVDLVFHGEENDLVVGFTAQPPLYLVLDAFAGILHVPLQTLATVGVMPASGSLTLPLTIGPLAPGVAFPLHVQAITLAGDGSIYLGNPSPSLVLGPG